MVQLLLLDARTQLVYYHSRESDTVIVRDDTCLSIDSMIHSSFHMCFMYVIGANMRCTTFSLLYVL